VCVCVCVCVCVETSRGLSETAELLVAYPTCIQRPYEGAQSTSEYCYNVWYEKHYSGVATRAGGETIKDMLGTRT